MDTASADKETFFTKAVIGLMLAAITVSSLVLGIVAVVAMNDGSESASGPNQGATVVQVHLTEFAISIVPDTVPPGDVVFQVMNHGSVEHNFSLPSLNVKTAMLKPGSGEDLATTLEAGDVAVLCEVSGHDAAGHVRGSPMAGARAARSAGLAGSKGGGFMAAPPWRGCDAGGASKLNWNGSGMPL